MSITYSQTAINARLQGVVSVIGAGGVLKLYGGIVLLSTIPLANPCGTVAGGVLTFTVPQSDPAASNTGSANTATIEDSGNNVMISGLSVGVPLSGANIIISNGLNSTLITAGQIVTLVSGQIIGS